MYFPGLFGALYFVLCVCVCFFNLKTKFRCFVNIYKKKRNKILLGIWLFSSEFSPLYYKRQVIKWTELTAQQVGRWYNKLTELLGQLQFWLGPCGLCCGAGLGSVSVRVIFLGTYPVFNCSVFLQGTGFLWPLGYLDLLQFILKCLTSWTLFLVKCPY